MKVVDEEVGRYPSGMTGRLMEPAVVVVGGIWWWTWRWRLRWLVR